MTLLCEPLAKPGNFTLLKTSSNDYYRWGLYIDMDIFSIEAQ